MVVYDKKDGVKPHLQVYARVNTGKIKKCRFLHLNYGIRVSYFWSGCIKFQLIILFLCIVRILRGRECLAFFPEQKNPINSIKVISKLAQKPSSEITIIYL